MTTKSQSVQLSSVLDPGSVLKSAHDDRVQSLRTYNSLTDVPPAYTKVDLVYNALGSCTEAKFYEGEEFHTSKVHCTGAASLNNKYITVYSADDKGKYTLWFNVDGLGTEPVVANSILLPIDLEASDPGNIVALSIRLTLARFNDFRVTSSGNTLVIENTTRGRCSPIEYPDTGFIVETVKEGHTKLIKHLQIPFTNNIRYIFNEIERKFEVFELVQPVVQKGDGFRPPPDADSFTIERPASHVEVFQYRKGGISGQIIYTVTITYTDNTKRDIASLEAL